MLTISLHQENCFPPAIQGWRTEGLAQPWHEYQHSASGRFRHTTYLRALETIVVPALESFRPEVIIVACVSMPALWTRWHACNCTAIPTGR